MMLAEGTFIAFKVHKTPKSPMWKVGNGRLNVYNVVSDMSWKDIMQREVAISQSLVRLHDVGVTVGDTNSMV